MRALSIFALSLWLGCGSPSQPVSGADATTGLNDDAAVVPSGMVFPPADVEVSIHVGAVADLNRDGIDDLVLLSRTGFADSNGVYILLGQQGRGIPEYHQFISTGQKHPMAVAAVDMGGSAALELLVVTVDFPNADNSSYVTGYDTTDGTSYSTTGWEIDIGAGGPGSCRFISEMTDDAYVGAGNFLDATPPLEIVFAQEQGICILQPQAWTAAGFPAVTRVNLSTAFQATGLFIDESTNQPGLDDFVVTSDGATTRWYRNDNLGTGDFPFVEMNGIGVLLKPVRVDFDGTGVDDLFALEQTGVLLQKVDTSGGSTHQWQGQGYITEFNGILDLVVTDTDSSVDTRKEMIFSDVSCENTGSPCLAMFRNVFVNGSDELDSLLPISRHALASGFVATHLFEGAFDGTGTRHLHAFTKDARRVCLELDGGDFNECP